jgi:foldase protein PrsA
VVAILLLAVAALAVTAAGCGGALPGDAVAKVGDVVILKSDFDKRVQDFASQYSVTPKEEDPEGWADFERDVLEYLVTYECVVKKAGDLNVTVTDDEVQKEIDSIVQTYYNGDQAAFETDLSNNKLTVEQLKLNYKESMLMQKVYEKVTEGVTTVPEDRIAAYYEQNKDKYYTEETRTTRHILIRPGTSATNPPTTTTTEPWGSSTTTSAVTTTTSSSTTTTSELTDADWSAALATAKEVRAKLEDGGDWKELAAEYSDDPSTAVNGGELGNVSKGQMVPEFEDSVFSLKLNEISQPVKSSYGYHIIQVTAINDAKQYTLDDQTVKDDITSTLLNELKTEAWRKWLADTKAEIGVVYQKGLEPTTTTAATTVTTNTSATTGTGTNDTTVTTVAPDTTTTAGGETIGGETTTTAKP